jgi:endonuclease/exonuclease/phosphatase (EEP) superfamily protein YafD
MKRLAAAVPWVLIGTVALLYGLRPVEATALTIFPVWTWAPLALGPAIWQMARARRATEHRAKSASALVVATILVVALFSEEWRSLTGGPGNESKQPSHVRVVSLNCAGGSMPAAAQVARYRPDIVLLQESPSSDEIERLGKEMFGPDAAALPGPDGSILSRYPLEALPRERSVSDHVAAIADIDGTPVQVVSLRLMPPTFRIDLYDPEAWRQLAENSRARRSQVNDIFRRLSPRAAIVGGDFNCQPNDRALGAVPGRFRDAFRLAGRGWGHTAVNDYPLARIDQVWITPEFKAAQVFVRKTENSDHRLVVADLLLRKPRVSTDD